MPSLPQVGKDGAASKNVARTDLVLSIQFWTAWALNAGSNFRWTSPALVWALSWSRVFLNSLSVNSGQPHFGGTRKKSHAKTPRREEETGFGCSAPRGLWATNSVRSGWSFPPRSPRLRVMQSLRVVRGGRGEPRMDTNGRSWGNALADGRCPNSRANGAEWDNSGQRPGFMRWNRRMFHTKARSHEGGVAGCADHIRGVGEAGVVSCNLR